MDYNAGFYAYWLIGGVIFGLLALRTWTRKGGSAVFGFLMGFLLGLIGLIIVALLRGPGYRQPRYAAQEGEGGWTVAGSVVPQPPRVPTDKRWTCPYCAQFVLQDARACGACGRELPLRSCPHCNYNTLATSETCGACMKRSEAWKLHNGTWWKREQGVVYFYDLAAKTWTPQS
jgi:hypothetical protein